LEPIETPQVKDIKSNQTHIPLSVALKYDLSKTISKVFYAFGSSSADKVYAVDNKDWLNLFDSSGRISSNTDVQVMVFQRGLDHNLRQEAWPHLLGVFPSDLTCEERTRFLFMKTQVYKHLKENWMAKNPREIQSITHMIEKDVLRTDRTHPFFNVKEDHPNLVALLNILTTFAFNNPDISYCQGMSDLAAPLLVILNEETLAYLSFCRIMDRLRNNFLLKGTALMGKFSQLSLLLLTVDKPLFDHLQEIEGGNLYFCYRMLLLEMKREFPFDDAINVLEVIWSSVPHNFDDEEEFYQNLLETNADEVELDIDFTDMPEPRILNDGSPFPLFLCLSILILNREQVMEFEDYTMLAMHFDKLSRKLDANKVIVRGKQLFFKYLKHYLVNKATMRKSLLNECLENSHGTSSTAAKC